MNSLKEVFTTMQGQDHVKEAQAQAVAEHGPAFANVDAELIKQAQDYDHIGRVLAHNVFADLIKQAMDEEMPEASDDDKSKGLAALMAKARGEKSDDKDKDKDDKDKDKDKVEEEKQAMAGMFGEGGDKDKCKKCSHKSCKGDGCSDCPDCKGGEKEASVRDSVLRRMAQDPEYVSHLIAKHYR